jgi:hypothetical protein
VTGVNCRVRVSRSKVPSFGSAQCVSPRPAPSLLGLRSLSALCLAIPVARHGLRAPSTSLQARQLLRAVVCGSVDPSCGTSRSFRCRRPRPAEASHGSAHGVTSSSGFDHLRPPRNAAYDSHAALEPARCLPEFPPLRRIERAESTLSRRGLSTARSPPRSCDLRGPAAVLRPRRRRVCLTRLRSACRVSHPLDGLLLHAPPGLVSSRWRPWGSLFRAFIPTDEP